MRVSAAVLFGMLLASDARSEPVIVSIQEALDSPAGKTGKDGGRNVFYHRKGYGIRFWRRISDEVRGGYRNPAETFFYLAGGELFMNHAGARRNMLPGYLWLVPAGDGVPPLVRAGSGPAFGFAVQSPDALDEKRQELAPSSPHSERNPPVQDAAFLGRKFPLDARHQARHKRVMVGANMDVFITQVRGDVRLPENPSGDYVLFVVRGKVQLGIDRKSYQAPEGTFAAVPRSAELRIANKGKVPALLVVVALHAPNEGRRAKHQKRSDQRHTRKERRAPKGSGAAAPAR